MKGLTYEAQLSGRFFVGVPHAQVENSIIERTAEEPLDGEVVDPLGCSGSVVAVISVTIPWVETELTQ